MSLDDPQKRWGERTFFRDLLIKEPINLNLANVFPLLNALNLIPDFFFEKANLVFHTGFAIFFLPIVMWIEPDEYKLIWKYRGKISIALLFIFFFTVLVCMFVSLYCQYSISYVEAVVDQTTMVSSCISHQFVVDKSFESTVNRFAHDVFDSYWIRIYHHPRAIK